jgi:hypothetical protein
VIFLVIYLTATSYFVFYLPAFLGFSLSSFNGIQEIYWGVDNIMLLGFGWISDRLMVREITITGAIDAFARARRPPGQHPLSGCVFGYHRG